MTERERFEAWAKGRLEVVRCEDNAGYMAYSTHCAWEAWQAARTVPDTHVPGWISVKDRLPPFGETAQFIVEGWRTSDEDYWIPAMNTWINGDGKVITQWKLIEAASQGSGE